MARFLFVVPPMTGHINPTQSVAAELVARGHQCAWVGYEAILSKVLPADATLYPLDTGEASAEFLADIASRAQTLRGLAGLKFLWQDVLVPLGREMAAGVDDAATAFAADVLVVDQQALAGAFVARRRGLPWATLATTSADRAASLGDLPEVLRWTEEQLADLQREVGLEPVDEPENSPHRVIVFSTAALVGSTDRFPDHHAFVGPSISHRRQDVEFPVDALQERPKVLVTLGTLNAERGEKFYAALKDGLGPLDVQVILVAPDEFGPFPDNFLVRDFVPMLSLLPRVDVVVCHAGHNTVCEALSHGLPLVVAPIKDDQPVVAGQVVDAGVGLRLSFTRPRPAALAEAVTRVLEEESFRAAARRVQRSFQEAGGARKAAELLEDLL